MYQAEIRWNTFLNCAGKSKRQNQRNSERERQRFKWVCTYFNFIFTTHVFHPKRILIIDSRHICAQVGCAAFDRIKIYSAANLLVHVCSNMYTSGQQRNGMYVFGPFYNLVLMFAKFPIIYRCTHRILSNGTNHVSFDTQVQIPTYRGTYQSTKEQCNEAM